MCVRVHAKMFRFSQFCRLFSSAPKSNLAKLRQKTGFPIGKCKDALTRHSNELEAAEKWLYEQAQKEGWAKVEKLQGRTASQGLIGLLLRGSQAAMVEVCCTVLVVIKVTVHSFFLTIRLYLVEVQLFLVLNRFLMLSSRPIV